MQRANGRNPPPPRDVMRTLVLEFVDADAIPVAPSKA
jgi:hypothetical protein